MTTINPTAVRIDWHIPLALLVLSASTGNSRSKLAFDTARP
ncbi:MAG: hypothetical protein V4858_16815 [Pseudomonadota bacterium]